MSTPKFLRSVLRTWRHWQKTGVYCWSAQKPEVDFLWWLFIDAKIHDDAIEDVLESMVRAWT